MARYVLLEHRGCPSYKPGRHWDLLLERYEALWAWELNALPTPGEPVAATRLPDHRPLYLSFEGPLSGHRGSVRQRDAGTYEVLHSTPERIEFLLDGRQFSGRFLLILRDPAKARWELSRC